MMVLFLVFFQIGLFSVGGGYAAMPLIQSLVVESHGWLTMAEFTNLMTIAEMTPGPIAVNSATFVGMRCAGLPGALVATFGCITPSLILVTLLSYLYGRFRSGQTMQNVLGALRPPRFREEPKNPPFSDNFVLHSACVYAVRMV